MNIQLKAILDITVQFYLALEQTLHTVFSVGYKVEYRLNCRLELAKYVFTGCHASCRLRKMRDEWLLNGERRGTLKKHIAVFPFFTYY